MFTLSGFGNYRRFLFFGDLNNIDSLSCALVG